MMSISDKAEGLLDAMISSDYITEKENILAHYRFFLENLKYKSPEVAIMLTKKYAQCTIKKERLLELYEYFINELSVNHKSVKGLSSSDKSISPSTN